MLESILQWAVDHPRIVAAIDAVDAALGRPVAHAVQRVTERDALRAQIRACGGEAPDDDVDTLRWRLQRLARVGNDKPGMARASARLATWFAIDEGMASSILAAVGDDEDRAVKVLLSAEADGVGLIGAFEHVDTWAATVGAQRLLLAWRIAAHAPPEMRLFWARKIAGQT